MCLFGDEDTKICSKCNKELPLHNFGIASGSRSDTYRRSECKKCLAEAKSLIRILQKTTTAPSENYVCPICEKNVAEIQGNAWCLDHCHTKKTFRGWLCHKCNRALGNFDDNIELLEKAINYIKRDRDEDTNQTLL
tara:strand:- start:616 stop:1023 length:408 start_codon:yes stop_codon:yes gene_type:complete